MWGFVKGLVGKILPTLAKQKAKTKAVDTLISSRGNASKAEVITALGLKYFRLVILGYIIYNVVAGNVTLGEILKILAINI